VTDLAVRPPARDESPAPRDTSHVERCSLTGITKPECHCPACLAALVAHHHRRAS
jgi:hypothetical protein